MHATHHLLFKSVPDTDYFHLFDNHGEPEGERIIGLLKFEKKDISVATNIPIESVRYDKKGSKELKQRLSEWATALNLVANFFKNERKTILWFNTPNPLLGDMTPRDMIRIGRFKKLLNFIQTALDENKR
jgi:hypothetical protein